jgi:hypothetical protein
LVKLAFGVFRLKLSLEVHIFREFYSKKAVCKTILFFRTEFPSFAKKVKCPAVQANLHLHASDIVKYSSKKRLLFSIVAGTNHEATAISMKKKKWCQRVISPPSQGFKSHPRTN